MAVMKVIELMAQSTESWEDAARQAVAAAAKSVRGIRSVYIQDFSAVVENDQLVAYRVNAKVTFEVEL
ncbi:dodecin domain-containing protein [bacterium]|nr:dodecin domain-containing protein [bacterium]